jgi:hypothetical protein
MQEHEWGEFNMLFEILHNNNAYHNLEVVHTMHFLDITSLFNQQNAY